MVVRSGWSWQNWFYGWLPSTIIAASTVTLDHLSWGTDAEPPPTGQADFWKKRLHELWACQSSRLYERNASGESLGSSAPSRTGQGTTAISPNPRWYPSSPATRRSASRICSELCSDGTSTWTRTVTGECKRGAEAESVNLEDQPRVGHRTERAGMMGLGASTLV